MTIIYQGEPIETSAATVAALLDEKGGAANAVVEYNGDILEPAALAETSLDNGSELNVYRIVSGG